jgi:pimeloyl-ACP methyl ester carboxylesterase
MTTFVLVHGAWHGGWCWDAVAAALREAGAVVRAPTLRGLGDRASEADDVGLEDHIAQITALAAVAGEPVVLVGHSYGGMVIEGVCDRLREGVSQAVFLDALTPGDGDCALPGMTMADIDARFGPLINGCAPPPTDMARLGITDPALAAAVYSRLTPHPVSVWLEPLRLRHGGSRGLDRTLVYCSDKPAPPAPRIAAVRADPSWRFEAIEAGHDLMLTHPAQSAQLLLGLVADRTRGRTR